MLTLVYKELVQLRSHLVQSFGILAAILLLFGKLSPTMMISYCYVFPLVNAMTIPQLSFTHEERGNTFVFLRSLPIRPGEIVGSKYLLSVLTTALFASAIFVAGPLTSMPSSKILTLVSVIMSFSLVIAGVSLFMHFWLGLKSARTALIVLTLVAAIPGMLVMKSAETTGAVMEQIGGIIEFTQTPAGVLSATALGLLAMAVSWALSTRIFVKRDIGQMP